MDDKYSALYWCLLKAPVWKLTKRNGKRFIDRFHTAKCWTDGKIAKACSLIETSNIEVLNETDL